MLSPEDKEPSFISHEENHGCRKKEQRSSPSFLLCDTNISSRKETDKKVFIHCKQITLSLEASNMNDIEQAVCELSPSQRGICEVVPYFRQTCNKINSSFYLIIGCAVSSRKWVALH